MAEVARKREGPSPKSLDSDENLKPLPTLFCRDIKIICDLKKIMAIFALAERLSTSATVYAV